MNIAHAYPKKGQYTPFKAVHNHQKLFLLVPVFLPAHQ